MLADVKEFSTGSLGWYLSGKTSVSIGGTPVSVQIGLNLTIVGSKELPQEVEAPAVVDDPGGVDALRVCRSRASESR
jgi:hypothetical protein